MKDYGPISKSENEAGGYNFNGPNTIKAKTEYSIGNNFGGVMIWEIGQDVNFNDSLSLLKAIYEGVGTYKDTTVSLVENNINIINQFEINERGIYLNSIENFIQFQNMEVFNLNGIKLFSIDLNDNSSNFVEWPIILNNGKYFISIQGENRREFISLLIQN